MDFFCRSISRRRRPSATLASSETLPSGRILPSRSRSSPRKSPIVARAAPRRGKRSAAAVSSDLASADAVEQQEHVEDLARFEAGAFDMQFVDGSIHVGQAVEIEPDGRAECGGLRAAAARRYSMASPASAKSSSRRAPVRLQFLQFPVAHRAGDVAAD